MPDGRHSARDKMIFVRKGRALRAKIIGWRDHFVRVAFNPYSSFELPGSDLAERLRQSELKKRQLERRIEELIGQG